MRNSRRSFASSLRRGALLITVFSGSCCSGTAFASDVAVVSVPQQQQQQLRRSLQVEGVPDGFVEADFSYEFYLFANADSQLSAVTGAVKDALVAKISADSPIFIESLVAATLGGCNSSSYELPDEYDVCSRSMTTVNTWILPSVGAELAKRVTLEEVYTFLTNTFNSEKQGTAHAIYDYPIYVKGRVFLTLYGATAPMNANEQEIFLSNFRTGFEPIMLLGAYEYGGAEVVVQQLATANGTKRQLQDSSREDFNKVELFVRGICAGPGTCFDDNFEKFLNKQMSEFASSFLTLLKTVGADIIFDSVFEMAVENDFRENDIVPLAPSAQIEVVTVPNDTDQVPSWVWILLAIVVGIWGCSGAWVCLKLQARQSRAAQYDARKTKSAAPSVYRSHTAQEQEVEEAAINNSYDKANNSLDQDSNDGFGQSGDDFSELGFDEDDTANKAR